MNFEEYQTKARTFRMESANALYALLNLSGEVGELHSKMAKALRDGIPNNDMPTFRVEVAKELGDILWHLAAIADDQGWTLEEIATANLDKLESRALRNKITGSGDNR
jgi:NTP pyrophosphatase (non-canonical NTP hydrolase)